MTILKNHCFFYEGNLTKLCFFHSGGGINDTLIGDPLLTVPLSASSLQGISAVSEASLCYEVHGDRDAWFNVLSDDCVSVNVHYAELNSYLNIVDKVAILAVDRSGECKRLLIELNGCTASINGNQTSTMYRSNGIFIRPYSSRVRIGVPNCNDNCTLIMWTICQNNVLTDPFDMSRTFQARMIKFVIARGLNLGATSHGIIG